MAKFDVESFADHFIALFQSKLSAKISAINTEKNDGIVIADITSAQYFSDMNEQINNYDEIIYYGFPSIVATASHAGGVSEEISMSFEVLIPCPEGGLIDNKKIMRYTRALKEVALENARANASISDLKIETFSPVVLQSNQNSPLMKAGGIMITGVITS